MNGMHGTRVAALLAVLFMAMTAALPAAAQNLGAGGAADDSSEAAYSTVFFGSYEQDGNTENGPEPIEWLVLEDDGETMTLLSRYILYGIDQVRSDYLDVDFLDDAFSPHEQKALLRTRRWETDGLVDRVCFALDGEEAEALLTTQALRRAEPTACASALGVEAKWFLTRTKRWSNAYSYYESDAYVDANGDIDAYSFDHCGMRPACRVNAQQLATPQPQIQPWNEPYTQVGSVVRLGHWEQNNISADGAEPIEWIVLESDGTESLLLARDALAFRAFGMNVFGEATWQNGSLCAWLNGEFLEEAFSEDEQAAIRTTRLADDGHNAYKSGGTIRNRVFLLSEAELLQYMPDEQARICVASDAAGAGSTFGYEAGTPVRWWLRTTMDSTFARAVSETGNLVRGNVSYNEGLYVRPAIRVLAYELTQETVDGAQLVTGADEARLALLGQKPLEQLTQVGQTVSLGVNPQSGEAIEWLVLDTDGTRSLLLSRSGVAAVKYSGAMFNPGWKGSDVRKWLAEEFLPAAFSPEEALSLLPAAACMQSGGDLDAEDRLFLLSEEEVGQYLEGDARVCLGKSEPCVWWLRTVPRDAYRGSAVDASGELMTSKGITDATVWVRPAVWIDLGAAAALPALAQAAAQPMATDEPTKSVQEHDPFDDY